ncbi:MAG: hypothetical protein ACR2Q4_08610 [Geminicoccaceae bacterium]
MSDNAKFNNARGTASSLQLAPPFAFKDVTMSVFPLRASLSRLESFCDAFLNHAGEAIRFQPFIPYVYLIILDYGRMSVEAANMGWISQREVAFSVPLRWMQKDEEDGILEFRDWAFNSPFIFVDNELSMSTGREVYGWPKTLAHLDPTISEWVEDPPGRRRVFNVSIKTVGRAFQGQRFTRRPFLNVYHRPATNILEYPPDLLGLFRPLAQLPNVGLNGARLAADLVRAMSGIVSQGITKTSALPDLLDTDCLKELLSRETLQACLRPSSWQPGLADLLWSLLPKLYANTINLKQFRDAASPVAACYQAITNAKMKLECIGRAGPLGQQNLLMGQIDGGYGIDIYRHGNLPIIDTLGLEIAASQRDGDVDIATLQPVCPFWMQVDMNYARGDVVSWRSSATKWNWQVKSSGAEQGSSKIDFEVRASDVEDLPDDTKKVADVGFVDEDDIKVQTVVDFKPTTKPTDNLYNTARGAGEELSGPFLSPNTTIRVLPLLADEATLDRFVSNYLDVEHHARYKAWGRHVYLVIYSYPSRSSESQNVGLIANREINFAVPVKCYDWFKDSDDTYDLSTPKGRKKLDRDKLTGVSLVVPFSYVDDVTVAITSSEVEGVPTLQSAIDSPPVRWMDTDGPDITVGSTLLDSSALVLPSLGVGAGAHTRSFLSVSTKPPIPYYDRAGWLHIAKRWGACVVDDLKRKFGQRGRRDVVKSGNEFRRTRAFALELLAGKLSIVNLTLKQFRDSWNTESACYQSLVQGRRKIDMLHEIQEIEQSLHVAITRFPTQPIAEVLGLIPKHTQVGSQGIVDVFEALRPFWLRADLSKDLGKNLYERVGSDCWTRGAHARQPFGWHPISVKELENIQADSDIRICFEHPHNGQWTRIEKGFEKKSDVKKLKQLQRKHALRHLMVWSRERKLSLMSNPMTLDKIDRYHVPDLAAYLESFKPNPKPISKLATCVGSIDPATVIDSILSRQWGRPDHRRREFGKSDFCLNGISFGTNFEDSLFPESEQQHHYWPQDSEFQTAYEDIRVGLALQIHRGVWVAINEAELKRPAKLSEDRKDSKKDYKDAAKRILPDWFEESVELVDPAAWDAKYWSTLADAIKSLISSSRDMVLWNPTIRRLTALMKKAREQAAIKNNKPVNPDDQPGRVAAKLQTRLRALARQQSG